MNYSEELLKIEKEIEKRKLEKVRLEERKVQIEKDLKEVRDDLKAEGIEEAGLEKEIETLETELTKEINNCNEILKGEEIWLK